MLLYCGKEVCNVTNCGFVPPGGSRIVPAGDGGGKGGGGLRCRNACQFSGLSALPFSVSEH